MASMNSWIAGLSWRMYRCVLGAGVRSGRSEVKCVVICVKRVVVSLVRLGGRGWLRVRILLG